MIFRYFILFYFRIIYFFFVVFIDVMWNLKHRVFVFVFSALLMRACVFLDRVSCEILRFAFFFFHSLRCLGRGQFFSDDEKKKSKEGKTQKVNTTRTNS